METESLKRKYLPMTETAYYILLSLNQSRHGYGIMQHVEEITESRIKLGAGTMYGTLSKLEKDHLIIPVAEEERRKIYRLSDKGKTVLQLEMERLTELLYHGKKEMGMK